MVCHWHDFHTLFTPGRYIRSETEKIIHLKTQKVPNVSLSGVSAVLQLPPNARWKGSSKASKLSNGPSCSGRPSLNCRSNTSRLFSKASISSTRLVGGMLDSKGCTSILDTMKAAP